eukprot:3625026-Rhodomonas_salina.2
MPRGIPHVSTTSSLGAYRTSVPHLATCLYHGMDRSISHVSTGYCVASVQHHGGDRYHGMPRSIPHIRPHLATCTLFIPNRHIAIYTMSVPDITWHARSSIAEICTTVCVVDVERWFELVPADTRSVPEKHKGWS